MDAIEVTARFDAGGQVTPLSFTWQGRQFTVDSTGRRWEDETGLHILVMAPGGRIYELLFAPAARRWFLGKIGQEYTVA
ncbi:MAG TPA: hypothetical protein VF823_02660 [Anaerolineales bacterium]